MNKRVFVYAFAQRKIKLKEKKNDKKKGNEKMNTNLSIINTSKIRGYKNAFYAVSLILIFAISIAMAFAPTASAQMPFTTPRPTAAYASVAPLVVGVGQEATVNVWVEPLPQDAALGS